MVEIIPRPVAKLPPWINILFYLSFVILIATISSYFILVNFLAKSQKNIQDLDEQLQQEETPKNTLLEKEVFGWERKIKDFSQLIDSHIVASNFFVFLENLVYPKVWFSQINFNSKEGKAVLSGHADSFLTLGSQLQLLFKEPLIQDISLAQVSISKTGEVDFGLNITINPKMLKW